MAMTSCGGPGTQVTPAAVLSGNWHLFGNFGQFMAPSFSMTIEVYGTEIDAQATYSVRCSASVGEGASGLTLNGTISPDGSFELSNSAGDSLQVVVQGQVPMVGAKTWSGSYAVTGAAGTSCPVQDSGSFDAVALPALTGVYSGMLSGKGLGSPNSIKVSLQLAQQPPASFSLTGSEKAVHLTPVNASISVHRTSCFSTGTTTTAANRTPSGYIAGDQFFTDLKMNNGSELQLTGQFADINELTIAVQVSEVSDGDCKGAFAQGTLTLQ
jgi:hypothetical protein